MSATEQRAEEALEEGNAPAQPHPEPPRAAETGGGMRLMRGALMRAATGASPLPHLPSFFSKFASSAPNCALK